MRMGDRRLDAQGRRGTALVAAAVAVLCAVAAGTVEAADAEWPCAALPPTSPWSAPSVWWEAGGAHFAQLSAADGAELRLRAVLRLHPLAQRPAGARTCPDARRGEAAAQLCVALVDTTAYTSAQQQENVAWVTLHTDPLLPAAVVEVDAACWARERPALSRCRPCVLAPSALRRLPLYVHSPLSRAFWAALDAAALPAGGSADRPWLHRLNMQANANRSARAEWLRLAATPALRSLELAGNAWADAQPQQLRLPPLPALRELRLHDNGITSLADDFLSTSQRLEILVLARNSLTRLPKSISNLRTLKLLDVTNPLSRGQSFHIDYISQLPNLRILGLENQRIVGDVMPILMMPSLMFLNMSGCSLDALGDPPALPMQTTDLQVLDLSNNRLEEIQSSIFLLFPKLIRLLLNGNNLRILSGSSTLTLPKLDYLDISNNHLKTIPTFQINSQLKILKAQNNAFDDFNETFWESLSLLEKLDLSENHLMEVPFLKWQNNLQDLDLSKNEIKLFHSLTFGSLKNLKSIDISNNLLTTIDPKVLGKFEGLKVANLSHNRLWYVSLSSTSLEIADLSYNLLTSIPILNTPSLYHLSLKENLLTSFNSTFDNASRLRELDISRNLISVADLHNVSFDVVDLSYNILKYLPTGSYRTQNLKVDGNPFNGDDLVERDMEGGIWDSWFIWILSGIAILAVVSAFLLVGVAILVRKVMKRNEPLVLSSKFRSPSPVSFNESPSVRFQ